LKKGIKSGKIRIKRRGKIRKGDVGRERKRGETERREMEKTRGRIKT
jgi:hypothetical protein